MNDDKTDAPKNVTHMPSAGKPVCDEEAVADFKKALLSPDEVAERRKEFLEKRRRDAEENPPEEPEALQRREEIQNAVKALRFRHTLPVDKDVILRRFGKMDEAKNELASKILDVLLYQCRQNAYSATEIASFISNTILVRSIEGGVGFPPAEYANLILEDTLRGVSVCMNEMHKRLQGAVQMEMSLKQACNKLEGQRTEMEKKDARIDKLTETLLDQENQIRRLKGEPAVSEDKPPKKPEDDEPDREMTGVL